MNVLTFVAEEDVFLAGGVLPVPVEAAASAEAARHGGQAEEGGLADRETAEEGSGGGAGARDEVVGVAAPAQDVHVDLRAHGNVRCELVAAWNK